MQRKIYPFFFVATAVVLTIYHAAGIPVRKARKLWLEGNPVAAIDAVENWSRLHIRPADFEEAMAVSYLSLGRAREAEPILRRLTRRPLRTGTLFDPEDVARKLVSDGRFEEAAVYFRTTASRNEDDDFALYYAAALTGGGKLEEASAAFARVDRDEVDPAEYNAVSSAIDERRKGLIPFLLDRNGKVLALSRGADVTVIDPEFEPLIDSSFGSETIEAKLPIGSARPAMETTLDPRVQHAAVLALGGYRGGLVAIDVETNEILAAASTMLDGPRKNIAFENSYEPGSVIKVLTILAAAETGTDLTKFFPLQCDGYAEIDGKIFYDWAKHDQVKSVDEALALSCNIAFAKLGMRVGAAPFKALLQQAGFGSRADLQLIDIPLGKPPGPLDSDRALANASCGLIHETISPVHLAILAAAIGNGGEYRPPKLVRARRSILGDVVRDTFTPESRRLASQGAVALAKKAMREVVGNQRGTGHRADMPELPIALKTGTAGNREPAYNSLIMAFAPADKPRVAIGIVAEHSGPAEFAAVKIARDFYAQLLDLKLLP